jgi:hypothetical protein
MPFNWKPLEPFRKDTVILSGCIPGPRSASRRHGRRPLGGGGVHVRREAEEDGRRRRQCGTTIDQLIAQKIGTDTLIPSMQLAVEDPGSNSSNCGEGYSCTYTNTISWATPTSPLPMELNPQIVFERMFGDGSTPGTARRPAHARSQHPRTR